MTKEIKVLDALNSIQPLVVNPQLATAIGLDKAIVLQQLRYWLNGNSAHTRDGHKWIYNTYEQWQLDNFPFWTTQKIGGLFRELEKDGLIISCKFSRGKWDHTKWYRISETKVIKLPDIRLYEKHITDDMKNIRSDDMKNIRSKICKTNDLIPETTTETKTEIKTENFKKISNSLKLHLKMNIDINNGNTKLLSFIRDRIELGDSVSDFSKWWWNDYWLGRDKGQAPTMQQVHDNWIIAHDPVNSEKKDYTNDPLAEFIES